MGAIGVVGKSSRCFYDILMNDLKLDETHYKFLVSKIIWCCIRTTYTGSQKELLKQKEHSLLNKYNAKHNDARYSYPNY